MHDLPLGSFLLFHLLNLRTMHMGVVRHLGKEGAKSRDMAFLHGYVHIPRKSGDTKIPTPVIILYHSSIMKL